MSDIYTARRNGRWYALLAETEEATPLVIAGPCDSEDEVLHLADEWFQPTIICDVE